MNGMTPQDVYLLAGCGDPRISPDGTTVSLTAWRIDKESNSYKRAVWLANVADGTTRQFSGGEKEDTGARWSPDGTRIAFTSNRDGDCKQIYVIPVKGGEARKLTDSKESAGAIAWSPDGTRIAFTARVRAEEYDEDDDRKRKQRRITTLWF